MGLPHKNSHIGTPFKRKGRLWSLGYHTGDDWLTPSGTTAYAMGNGVVRSVSRNNSYGLNIIVESQDVTGRTVRWSVNHLSSASVKTGQKVKAGQAIGKTGQSGHVTGPHDHVEVRKAPFTFASASFLDPQVMYDVKAAVAAWLPKRPAAAPALAFRLLTQNVGGMNDHGRALWAHKSHRVAVADDLASSKADFIHVQELSDAWLDDFSDLMTARSYRRCPQGSDGRWIFRLVAHPRGDSGTFDLKPLLAKDDKQAAWTVVYPDGGSTPWLLVDPHLESEPGADELRVDQANNLIDQAEAKALALGVDRSRIVYAGDFNSETWVTDKAFGERKYVDSALVAWQHAATRLATFLGFGVKAHNGGRVDFVFVDRTRPVRRHYTRTKHRNLYDHLGVLVDIGSTK